MISDIFLVVTISSNIVIILAYTLFLVLRFIRQKRRIIILSLIWSSSLVWLFAMLYTESFFVILFAWNFSQILLLSLFYFTVFKYYQNIHGATLLAINSAALGFLIAFYIDGIFVISRTFLLVFSSILVSVVFISLIFVNIRSFVEKRHRSLILSFSGFSLFLNLGTLFYCLRFILLIANMEYLCAVCFLFSFCCLLFNTIFSNQAKKESKTQ